MSEQEKIFATGARITDERLVVELWNGNEVNVPLAISWRLMAATPAQRENYVLEDRGTAIRWPEVDEDIGVAFLLGLPERVLEELVDLWDAQEALMPGSGG
jgi:hypothetical protein